MVEEVSSDEKKQQESKIVRVIKNIIVAGAALISIIYLLNLPFFDLLPDIIPILGNLDEATAVLLLIISLKYFGIDLTGIFGGVTLRKKA